MLIEEGIIKKEIGRRRTARIRGIITMKKQRNNGNESSKNRESTDNERRAIEAGEKKSVFNIGGLVRV